MMSGFLEVKGDSGGEVVTGVYIKESGVFLKPLEKD